MPCTCSVCTQHHMILLYVSTQTAYLQIFPCYSYLINIHVSVILQLLYTTLAITALDLLLLSTLAIYSPPSSLYISHYSISAVTALLSTSAITALLPFSLYQPLLYLHNLLQKRLTLLVVVGIHLKRSLLYRYSQPKHTEEVQYSEHTIHNIKDFLCSYVVAIDLTGILPTTFIFTL